MKKLRVFGFGLLVAGFSFNPILVFAQGELLLESTSEGVPKIDAAVLPFQPKDGSTLRKLSPDPAEVIAKDLQLSGRFNVHKADAVDTAAFHRDQVSVYVTGVYRWVGGKLMVEGRLHDAYSLNLIASKEYTVTEGSLRRAAHLFSDEMVYRLFGEKGFAATRIACVMKKGQSKEIVVVDYDGQGMTAITKNERLNLTPAWSPDNKGIVYTSYRNQTPALYLTWIYTGETKRLTGNADLNFSPSWNGVDNRIAFASSKEGNCEIFTMDPDGGNVQRLTFAPSVESSPCFSSNGYEIAFTSDRTGNPQVYGMDNEGANVRRLTFSGKYNDAPAWSPKGDKVAYISLEREGFNIYTIDVDGGNARKLTENAGNNEHPSFSPDGRLMVFSSTREGGSDLYLMNADGTSQTRITFSGNISSPEWSGY